MDQQQEPQHHQQGQQQASPIPAPIAPNPNGMVAATGHPIAAQPGQGMLMGLMTNPALAAAAAASPLFPPAAMLTNPGAFFAMPDVFAASTATGSQSTPTIQGHIQPTNVVSQVMQPIASLNGTATVYTDALGNQVQHVHSGNQHVQYGQIANPSGIAVIPGQAAVPGNSSMHVHMVAAAAAAQAVAESEDHQGNKDKRRRKDLSAAEKAKQNRDRNREHARSTRLRKKAYVQKLKELVEGLHAERTEEVRQRRVAIEHLAEMQNVRRAVIRSFLTFHSNNERDKRKWSTILEDDFWLKQPVTPYRCFRRAEIEQECRMSRGIDATLADAASVAVMIEGVGSRSARWMQIKREDFFLREEERTGRKIMPRNIGRQNGRFQHAVSSLSSSSANSSNTGSSGEDSKKKQKISVIQNGESSIDQAPRRAKDKMEAPQSQHASEDFHDYHAKPLPDPKLQDSERGSSSPSEDSPEESNASTEDRKQVSTDSSSGDDSAAAIKDPRPMKRRKQLATAPTAGAAAAAAVGGSAYLPQNIAKKGGISHNIVPYASKAPGSPSKNGNSRLSTAPAIALPPFSGLGKRSQPQETDGVVLDARQLGVKPPGSTHRSTAGNGTIEGRAVIISGDVETSSSNSSNNRAQIRAYYHVNEDDMILMEDILMCPFVFKTQEAVLCGALAECIMPGMLRSHFSSRNKLISIEMSYDSMGFMQQLERASGSEMMAQIIPGSLEMALSPSTTEARVITQVEAPFLIVNVNEAWTKLTKYTQMEVEGLELFKVLEGEAVDGQPPSLPYELEAVSNGQCNCATRLHFDKEGEQFVDFICSYPLTNTNDEITHILHISKELPPIQEPD